MKPLNKILPQITPEKEETLMIFTLIRRGKTTQLSPPRPLNEMVCQDCLGRDGYTCYDAKKKAWFCANPKCLKTDSEISKARTRQRSKEKHVQELRDAETKKLTKEWDGT